MRAPGGKTEVLVVGAGPTGLALALWLVRMSIKVRIIDKTAEPGTTSRALAVQARTLEFYSQLGLSNWIVEHGRRVDAVNLWVAGSRRAHIEFGAMGAGISPFPYALIYPQDEHETFLIDALANAGVHVERQTELTAFSRNDSRVIATLRKSDGAEETCVATYLAGCDGAHSTVREQLGVSFPGDAYEHLFYVADVEAVGHTMNGELHAALDDTDFLIVFPLKHEGHARLIGTIRENVVHLGGPSWNDVSKRVMDWLQVDVARVNWFSTYRVHHRVATSFREGNLFLLGDAAHIHSPVGGQGMNTGIGDAVNLAWKLAAVLRNRADTSLLDTYEFERIAFAERLVATTDRVFTGVTSSSRLARWLRLGLLPKIAPLFFRFAATRRLMFRTISQTSVNYRRSILSEGQAGMIHGGDRLPWVRTGNSGDNFAALRSLQWQLQVYGAADPGVVALCQSCHLELQVFEWQPAMANVGFVKDALYLVRPDGYIGFTERPHGGLANLRSYLER